MAVTTAIAIRMFTHWLKLTDFVKLITKGRRMAMVMGAGGHYASSVAAKGLEKQLGESFIGISANTPVDNIVEKLNSFKPTLLAPYASLGALLATEQEVGNLNISPVLIALSAEGLPENEYKRISNAFKCQVGNSYASTECPFLSFSCNQGWLHLNMDWAILEPVDSNYNPTPLGTESFTVLLTNLANKVQPIVRYDLGDSILMSATPCSCGNPLPAFKVKGRSSEVLIFKNEKGQQVSIPPLAFSISVDSIVGVERIQIVQSEPTRLSVRVIYSPSANKDEVGKEVLNKIRRLLDERGLMHVQVSGDFKAPEQTKGGKFRQVIPFDK
jgi:phenylacetate-CoA ligase